MATVVVIITSMVVANAVQAITTPNAALVTYSLAAGANSAPITPATSRSVLVMGCCTTSTTLLNPGVGQVNLLHIPSIFYWVSLESGGSGITNGFGNGAGAHIVYIDVNHTVEIQVASANTILIHNGASSTRAGNVTLIW